MRFVPRSLLGGGLGFTVSLVVAACGGGSGLLSSDQASTINSQLNQISTALQAGDCRTVSSATVTLSSAVANLPASISPTLRSNLDQGISTVGQLANRDCRPSQATTTPKTTTTTSTSTTSSTPTTTTSTSTTTTTPTSPTTSTSATTPAGPGTTSTGSGGAGLGNGNGNGNGNSGGASAGNGNGG
jgi:hypothetical protein